jgi:hypothetical protein
LLCQQDENFGHPVIVSMLHTLRGAAIDLDGEKLQDVIPRLKREVIDGDVEVSFKDASYR